LANKLFCTCGHPKDQHQAEVGWLDGASACFIDPNEADFHLCVYKLDNLIYLEEEYAASHK